jgi:hypothetical protein
MDDLMQFLRDRLAIEEHVAKAASPGPWHINAEGDEVLAVDDIVVADGFALSGRQLRATTEHIARHDPARVLREVEAKRRLLDLHEPGTQEYVDGDVCMVCTLQGDGPYYPCDTLRLLALPYADHPDYREDWRP